MQNLVQAVLVVSDWAAFSALFGGAFPGSRQPDTWRPRIVGATGGVVMVQLTPEDAAYWRAYQAQMGVIVAGEATYDGSADGGSTAGLAAIAAVSEAHKSMIESLIPDQVIDGKTVTWRDRLGVIG